MRLRLNSLLERAHSSLFFVPLAAVIVAILLGAGCLAIDRHLNMTSNSMPFGLASTVDSARTLLGTIASATISFAGVAFSVSLLVIQLTSTQYSPRVTHTLFRDPFNRRIVAMVVGTFTYCVVVLRSVRSALEDGGQPIIPNISVALAVVLGIITILAVVAFIDHSSHAMDVSKILAQVRQETVELVRDQWPLPDSDRTVQSRPVWSDSVHTVRFAKAGWVQQIDVVAMLDAVPLATTLRLDTYAGRYAIVGAPICTVSPAPADPDDIADGVRAAVATGETRTMQQDASYGLRQMVDVAVKALSPGINDPGTAQDAVFHVAAALAEMLRRDLPDHDVNRRGRRVLMVEQPTHADLVSLAFDGPRHAAANQPEVCLYLLAAIGSLVELVVAESLGERIAPLVAQAGLVVAGCEQAAGNLPEDVERVRAAYVKHFAGHRPDSSEKD